MYTKMSSVMPFIFNAADLYIVAFSYKSWTHAREMRRNSYMKEQPHEL